jgi:hypothetical protein
MELQTITDSALVSIENYSIQEYKPEVSHAFSKGVYLREIFMKANSYIIGKLHKTEHFNIILKGSAYVLMNDNVVHIQAPFTFVSPPNTRKVLWVTEDMIWQTVHSNPKDNDDTNAIEQEIIEDSPIDPSMLIPIPDMIKIGDMQCLS